MPGDSRELCWTTLMEDLGKSCEDIASGSQLELREESADAQSEPKTCLIVERNGASTRTCECQEIQ